ncbi:hypothetical protein CPB84DRAFT_1889744 [Gymnopilus junonius]|uniref:PHD-type domain-containing protein n=1 Tax=Gymnopilus junonius TaxID=109634 RepID=A0A9P5NVZ2_GYMJU|nr:hypothetical protein CPB84DRAFT_1889744 [Gymnopilus junonius]
MATTASLPAYMLPGVAIHQPPHLEGDASLATEILPGPPSVASLQQNALKRDPRKPSLAYSYLPPSDPGSTYSGLTHGTLIGQDLEGPRSKRSRVDKRTVTGRAQRASARNQGTHSAPPLDTSLSMDLGTSSLAQPIVMDPNPATPLLDKEPSISRSNSSLNLHDPLPPNMSGKPKRKDKGKAKETDTPPLRVKEEPKPFSLLTPDPPSNLLNNEDHCSACLSYGSLVYCDGCPRAFHFWCLDPPMEDVDDDGDARWFCSTCVARKHPPRKPPPSLLSAVIHQVQISNPIEFQLPEDIKTFFKDVASGPKGNYVDSSEIKPPRLNRHGQLEERDPYRLRDRNGGPVLCFQCGMSALPTSLTTSAPATKRPRRSTSKAVSADGWRSIVSCDYCNLHWHMDCLDPPLLTLPPFSKKWMCPNHAERILPPKRRIPKQHAAPIEITKSHQYNNGNIEVIHPEYLTAMPKAPVPVEEVLINGRRYRVPERVIVLDFWNKLNKWDEHVMKDVDTASGMSSPLTSLSSLDDSDDHLTSPSPNSSMDLDDLSAAQLLCEISMARKFEHSHTLGHDIAGKKSVEHGIQTDIEPPKPVVTKNKVGRPRKHPLPAPITNGTAKLNTSVASTYATPSNITVSTVRRKRASQQVLPEASSRELRSRSRNHNNDTPLTSVSSLSSARQLDDSNKDNVLSSSASAGTVVPPKAKGVNVKLEEIDNPSLMSTSFSELSAASSSTLAKAPRSVRTPRQAKQKDIDATVKDTKEKKGRKRKIRDDELPVTSGENGVNTKIGKEEKFDNGEKLERESRRLIKTPARLHAAKQETTPTSSAAPINSPSLSITPSLKIRLPRLSNLNSSNGSSIQLETPTRR